MKQRSSLYQLKGVTKQFGSQKALDTIDLKFETGHIHGIIGKSGVGKSTLIRCLARLEEPTEGVILFEGSDIAHLKGEPLHAYRQQIGMVFQQFNLLSSRTAAGNIAYPLELISQTKEQIEKRVVQLLELVGLPHKKNSYPSCLSGGEKQRVCIARALAANPKVLLCDEATSALDPTTTIEILDLLQTINKSLGVSVILITHEMDVIKRICHHVSVLHQGTIVESGLVSEIFAKPTHSTTKQFLQNTLHELPVAILEGLKGLILRLTFQGSQTQRPLIADLVRRFNVDPNILMGWIDPLQDSTLGSLIIELKGAPQDVEKALAYLQQQHVSCEVLKL